MLRGKCLLAVGALIVAVGCGGEATKSEVKAPTHPSGKKSATGTSVSKEAADKFETALQDFVNTDAKGQWDNASCKSVAQEFKAAADEQRSATNQSLAEALYDSGLAYQRCGMDKDARAAFDQAVSANSKFHRARVQLALYDYQRNNNLDSAIGSLEQIIHDAQFQNVEALVAVAALQMERGSDQSNSDGKDDLDRAKKNLQRALAIDDGYMPAFNQLSLYYLEQARAKAEEGGKRKGKRRGMVASSSKASHVNEQMLDLAALVASQAQRKNPKYAALHNTTGLIQVELRNFNSAVKSFAAARSLDPDFFEAHMNYAAVNLSFRGFEQAEAAYREALRLRPNEFEAHLGLALAIRGQITPANREGKMPEAEKQLAEAKKLAPNRPETYYNEAILTQEFKAKAQPDEDKSIAMMKTAIRQYEDFTGKAGGDSAFADAVKRSNERIKDMRDTIKFLEDGKKSREEAAKEAAKKPPPTETDKGGAAEPGSKGGDTAGDAKAPADAQKPGADGQKPGTEAQKSAADAKDDSKDSKKTPADSKDTKKGADAEKK
jgi:tetratricopeptide (TPR) repeat protein